MKRRFFLFLALVAVAGGVRAERVDLLLAAANDGEMAPLVAQLTDARTETHVAWTWHTGKLGDKKVVLVRTEGDPLNAVAVTTLALRRFQPKLVVTFGSARAHDPALQAGDVVVSEKFAAFDGMITPRTGLDAGSDATRWFPLPHPMMTAGEKESEMMAFSADANALATVRKLSAPRGRMVVGVLGSANQVNREADRIAWLRKTWGTSCEDGESAHVGGCALLFKTPAIGLRVIDGREGEAAALVQKFLEAWK